MTPFGLRLRELRRERGLTQRQMARDLMISGGYLSALEHGRKGEPSVGLLHQICEYFGIIWDEAEELRDLAHQSRPRVAVDTSGLTPTHMRLANTLARTIADLGETDAAALLDQLEARVAKPEPETRPDISTRPESRTASR